MNALERHLRTIAKTGGLRAVIITGTGRAFCAGGDLLEFEATLRDGGAKLIDTLRYNQDVIQLIEDLPVPVIAAVNGTAAAGGLEMLHCCDIIVAVEGARIGDAHSRVAIVPAGGSTVRLVERLGRSRASQLFYTAELVPAETMRDWGLVNEIVSPGQLMQRAQELAREICQRSPEVNRHIKALVHPGQHGAPRAKRIRAELDRFEEHLDGSDLRGGLAAFRTKQDPGY
jgi:enoyl-CoA hydratase/carnithine racemase